MERINSFSLLFAGTIACLSLLPLPTIAQNPCPSDPAEALSCSAPLPESKRSEQQFLVNAAYGGMAEVELSKLALERASNPAVREFAQQMVTQHTQANNQLKRIAAQEQVQLPSGLKPEHQVARAMLSQMSGANFDRAYMREMVKAHASDAALFQKQATCTGGDRTVQNFAAQLLPTIQNHLQMALVVSARSQDGLQTLVDEIQQIGGTAIAVPADVAEFEQVKAIADKTVDYYGRLDTWVHAAATAVFATFDNLTPEEFKRIIDVNLMGQVYGAMAALPHLKREGRGSLIHVSSVEGRRSLPYQSAYSSSKHGIQGFLDALRLELMHEKLAINVTSIMPGVINTPFYSKTKSKLGVKPTGIPPYYQPHLVAAAILDAAEHPQREIVVSDVGKIVDILQRLSPQLMDTFLLQFGFQGQLTKDTKSENSPNNLYEPIEDNRIEGDFSHLTVPSITDWFNRNPAAKATGTAVGLAIAALLASQIFKGEGTGL